MRYATGPGATRPVSLSTNGEWLDTPNPRNWLVEWLENKGQYVLLSCQHTEDLNFRGLLIIGKRVYCDQCEEWAIVRKSIRFIQYVGLELPPAPKEPLY